MYIFVRFVLPDFVVFYYGFTMQTRAKQLRVGEMWIESYSNVRLSYFVVVLECYSVRFVLHGTVSMRTPLERNK